jgi:hypothetical protein
MSQTNTGSFQQVLLGYTEVMLTGVNGHTYTSSPGSVGKLTFKLVRRLEKRVDS